MPDPKKEPGIALVELFIESAKFGHRLDYLRTEKGTVIETGLKYFAVAQTLDDNHAVFRMRVASGPMPSGEAPLYDFDLTIAALFMRIEGEENLVLSDFVKSPAAVATVFPLLRSAVGDLTIRGRFGPIWLNPINPRTFPVVDLSEGMQEEIQKQLKGAEPPVSTRPKD